ncbi:repressor LexA, partial [Dietzia maris]
MPKPDFESLTDRQKSVLLHIHDTVKERGYPPSIREIGDAVGLQSTSSVAHQLRTLEKKGFLTRDPHKPRAVDVHGVPGQKSRGRRSPAPEPQRPGGAVEPVYVPVLGRIAAGGPIL